MRGSSWASNIRAPATSAEVPASAALPVTYWTFLIGSLAIAGVPGLAGFFSKDEILQLYLNKVYLGDGLYGVEAASLGYFGKHASEIDVADAILESVDAIGAGIGIIRILRGGEQRAVQACAGFDVQFDVIEWNTLFTNWRKGAKDPSANGSNATNVSFAARSGSITRRTQSRSDRMPLAGALPCCFSHFANRSRSSRVAVSGVEPTSRHHSSGVCGDRYCLGPIGPDGRLSRWPSSSA